MFALVCFLLGLAVGYVWGRYFHPIQSTHKAEFARVTNGEVTLLDRDGNVIDTLTNIRATEV